MSATKEQHFSEVLAGVNACGEHRSPYEVSSFALKSIETEELLSVVRR